MKRAQSKTNSSNGFAKTKDTVLDLQRREKLKDLLFTKFKKKYNLKEIDSAKVLQEISRFIQGDKLTEFELNKLDIRIKAMVTEYQKEEVLAKTLDNKESLLNSQENAVNHAQDDTISVRSRMSGCSHLSKFSERQKQIITTEDFDDKEAISLRAKLKVTNRLDFNEEGDEWVAIAKHNKLKYEEEKKENFLKDKELKRRQREALLQQMKEKQERLKKEKDRNLEMDEELMQNVEFMNKVEKEKYLELKKKVMKEKENRDRQLEENHQRRREEFKQERRFDKTLIAKCLQDIQKEKQSVLDRKTMEKEHLNKVLAENENNKRLKAQELQKEREEDIKACEEYTKILDKQEKDRENYFLMRQKRQNEFMSRMVETVIKDQDAKQRREDEINMKYQMEKNRRDDEEEARRKLQIKMNKKDMRSFLNSQISDKKKLQEFEKSLDNEQLRIFQKDFEEYLSKSKESNQKLRETNLQYQDYLKMQMEARKRLKQDKMSDNEYLLNIDILEDIKKTPKMK